MRLDENMILYHGSYMIVEHPDLARCRKGKDFGQGFYVTTSKEQAKRFTKTSIKKAVFDSLTPKNNNIGYVSKYSISNLKNLNIHVFEEANAEWLHCVVAHRKKNIMQEEIAKWKVFDIICGKIADDNTNLVLTAYMNGVYGEVGSEEADEVAIKMLEPKNLKDQICFRTNKAIDVLNYIGNESVIL